ncbi:MAG: radical SAM protein [Planctomycetes bacterium]|nr:radical SAM protein [Planctomycetota bacterium]MCB9905271.1 radical SAM protein [Planctomycetota bacterium]
MRLNVRDHDRGAASLTYVYPVVSRRAQGVSIGINLNPNNACNFRCVYCQVPELVKGKAPEIDVEQLAAELDDFLREVLEGDFMETQVPAGSRRLNDVAFSGNGEPTSVEDFDAIVVRVLRVLEARGVLGELRIVVITNGTLVHRDHVQAGLRRLAEHQGEVWFKLDSATPEGRRRINDDVGEAGRQWRNLQLAARACPTWLQTCVFEWNGEAPSRAERDAYLDLLRRVRDEELPLEGVLLYGLARPSHQPEAPELARLPEEWLEAFAQEIRALGFTCRVHP